jgi:hypothetical protein
VEVALTVVTPLAGNRVGTEEGRDRFDRVSRRALAKRLELFQLGFERKAVAALGFGKRRPQLEHRVEARADERCERLFRSRAGGSNGLENPTAPGGDRRVGRAAEPLVELRFPPTRER